MRNAATNSWANFEEWTRRMTRMDGFPFIVFILMVGIGIAFAIQYMQANTYSAVHTTMVGYFLSTQTLGEFIKAAAFDAGVSSVATKDGFYVGAIFEALMLLLLQWLGKAIVDDSRYRALSRRINAQ